MLRGGQRAHYRSVLVPVFLVTLFILYMSWNFLKYTRSQLPFKSNYADAMINKFGFTTETSVIVTLPDSGDYNDYNEDISYTVLECSDSGVQLNVTSYPRGYYLPSHERFPAVWVKADGIYIDRLKVYNEFISNYKHRTAGDELYPVTWKESDRNVTIIWSLEGDYLTKLANISNIKVIALEWHDYNHKNADKLGVSTWSSREDKYNLLVSQYYQWTGSQLLCDWITNPCDTLPNYAWDAVFRKQCATNLETSVTPISLEVLYLSARRPDEHALWPESKGGIFPDSYYFSLPQYAHYMHIINDALVTTEGDVITGSTKLVQYTCTVGDPTFRLPRPPEDASSATKVREVFVISQRYNEVRYHACVEQLPRLVPYLDFLLSNRDVRIHSQYYLHPFVEISETLGLGKERFVFGTVRANTVYLPQHTNCGMNQVQATQLMSHMLRDKLKPTLKHKKSKRNSILFIWRKGVRMFKNNQLVSEKVDLIARNYEMDFETYDDVRWTPQNQIYQMFSRALIIIAPHGAGLVNLLWSEPGTCVIECVCAEGKLVMYYQWLAHTLGMRWHGLPSNGGCEDGIDINVTEIETLISFYAKRVFKSVYKKL